MPVKGECAFRSAAINGREMAIRVKSHLGGRSLASGSCTPRACPLQADPEEIVANLADSAITVWAKCRY